MTSWSWPTPYSYMLCWHYTFAVHEDDRVVVYDVISDKCVMTDQHFRVVVDVC